MDFLMEQLPIDSYMLIYKQKQSISINQYILSFKFDTTDNEIEDFFHIRNWPKQRTLSNL